MLRTIDLRGGLPDPAAIRAALPRPAQDPASVQGDVVALIEDVRVRGEAALLEQADRFDGGRPPAVRVRTRWLGRSWRPPSPSRPPVARRAATSASNAPGRWFSTSTSAPASNRRITSLPPSRFRSSATERLLAFCVSA